MNTRDNNKRTYREAIYGTYVKGRSRGDTPDSLDGFSGREKYFSSIISRFIPSDKSSNILEIGCGYGALIFYLKKSGYSNLLGIDTSVEQVDAARRLGIDSVQQSELMSFISDAKPRSYDCIVALDVFEHFTRNELLDIFVKLKKILTDTGKIVMHVPNATSPFFGRIRYGDLTHEIAFTPASITQLLIACGFNGIKCYEDGPTGTSIKNILQKASWILVRNVIRFCIAAETGDSNRRNIYTQNMFVVADNG